MKGLLNIPTIPFFFPGRSLQELCWLYAKNSQAELYMVYLLERCWLIILQDGLKELQRALCSCHWSVFTCNKVCCLMWGISPSFWSWLFLVHNLYIYLTCFCVHWPPAFFKGRVLRDFLSCSLALFWSRKLLLSHMQEHWQTQRPNSCHRDETETHAHTCGCSVLLMNSEHTLIRERHSLLQRLWDRLSCSIAWGVFTQHTPN